MARHFKKREARRLTFCVQTASLATFLFLLFSVAGSLAELWLPADIFLRLDPLAALLMPTADRQWVPTLAPGLALLLLTVAAGRFFCGWICPFGATLTLIRRLTKSFAPCLKKDALSKAGWRHIKYFALLAMLGAAALGVNDFYWGSPIPLITRFYALLLHPLLLLLGNFGLTVGQPLFAAFDWTGLSYLQVNLRRFDSLYFLLAFFGTLFLLEHIRPRFWCRYLCPAGGLLALFAIRPFWRRRVAACTHCGRCMRECPSGAIDPDTMETRHGECFVCRACVTACPERGVAFGRGSFAALSGGATVDEEGGRDAVGVGASSSPLPSRRAFLGATGMGMLLAGVQRSGAHSLLGADSREGILSAACIRPPGAVPESRFSALCLRCGECMKVCPANALQPAWLAAGPEGLFSPVLTPRLGPCEPGCNACGRVCPSQAIAALPLPEKQWAKVGTAVVLRERCLVWAEGRRCMVCQEVCPYGAVKILQQKGIAAPAPVVDAARCYGCGYCERHCPVRVSAVVVEPLNALRLNRGSYMEAGMSAGLSLKPQNREGAGAAPDKTRALPEGELPPGFNE
ncbi:4Fe-4S binding protein [Candidatus Desulfovibrio trichonymphae]|uniref:4Fe-4S ferredoxin n=1 Tax=Candidatus Desulfovibrio trichonymphae TaxID=1725232 RepID=A0A1J1E1F4_9BACT|nr:4Fe-4S binding protein [Candidatus Desulfovibrio trichonymphae]BAV91707.1 4Fe-4S ferredoxin [Candidatus Desulfovibrio trichonymphae]